MIVIAIIAFATMILASSVAALAPSDSHQQQAARIQAEQYLAYAMTTHFVIRLDPAVGFDGPGVEQLSWNTILKSAFAPPGVQGLVVPPQWAIVGNGSDWTICASLSERAELIVLSRLGSIESGTNWVSPNTRMVLNDIEKQLRGQHASPLC